MGFFVFGVGQASAATRYVDPSLGTDDALHGSGIGINALATLEYAVENFSWSYGDEIALCSGTYNDSSGLWKSGTNHIITFAQSGGAGYFIVRAQTGSVTIDYPSALIAGSSVFGVRGAIKFQHIFFTNSHNALGRLFYVVNFDNPLDIVFEDGGIDNNNTSGSFYGMEITNNTTPYNATLTFERMKIKNWNHTSVEPGFIRQNVDIGDGSKKSTIIFKSCLLKNVGNLLQKSINKMTGDLTLINNTIVNGVYYSMWGTASYIRSDSAVILAGNLVVGDSTFYYPINVQNLVPALTNGRYGPPTNWTIKGNDTYRVPNYSESSSISKLYEGGNEVVLPDETNYYLNPDFTDPANDDYTPRNGMITGKGYATLLPSTDINGNNWTSSADVGAFKNSVVTTPTSLGGHSIIFVGDSIAAGTSMRMLTDDWLADYNIYGAGSDCNTRGANCSSWGGLQGMDTKYLVDRSIETWGIPEYFIILTYANSIGATSNSPPNLTSTQAADDILTIVKKVQGWGSTPIVLGMMPHAQATFINQLTAVKDFNSKVKNVCDANSVDCIFPLDHMVLNPYFANAYNDGTHPGYYPIGGLVGNVHPQDPEGRRCIISVIEDYILNRSGINITQSGTSIVGSELGNGTYRYPLSVAGLNLQYSHDNYSDLPSNNINIYGLTANKWFNIETGLNLIPIGSTDCNDLAGGIIACKSDINGNIYFSYDGTYTTHTFSITEGDNIAPTVTDGTNAKFHTNTTQVTLALTTTENSTCKYSTENTLYDNMTSFTTTGETSHSTQVSNLTPNDYTYYAICRDTVGNDTSYTLNFEIAQKENKTETSDIDLKIKRNNSPTQTLNEDHKLFVKDDHIELKGQDDALENGTVKIYKNNKRYATVNANFQGEWSKNLSFGHNKTYTLKLKFYDQFGTKLNEKEYEVKIDTKKPTFTNPWTETLNINENNKLDFKATDDNQINYYKIKLLNQAGHIIRSWKKQNKSTYTIPEKASNKVATVIVRAYDEAGNYIEQRVNVNRASIETPADTETSESKETSAIEKIDETQSKTIQQNTENNIENSNQQIPEQNQTQQQIETKTFRWWNPWSWF